MIVASRLSAIRSRQRVGARGPAPLPAHSQRQTDRAAATPGFNPRQGADRSGSLRQLVPIGLEFFPERRERAAALWIRMTIPT